MIRDNKKPLIFMALMIAAIPLFGADMGLPNWISWVASALALVVGIFIPQPHGDKFKIIKEALLTLIRVVDKVLEARHADSDEGKKVTDDEWKEIWAELEGVVNIIRPLVRK